MLGGACERSYGSLARLPQQLHEQHALLSLMSWAYSACILFALPFQRRGALSRMILHFSFALPLFVGSFAGHLENKIEDPRHFTNFRNMAVRITSVFSQRDYRIRIYLWYDVQIHACIQTPLAFYTLMWGSLRLTPISTYGIGAITGLSILMLDISNGI